MPEGLAYCLFSIVLTVARERRHSKFDAGQIDYIQVLKRQWAQGQGVRDDGQGLRIDAKGIFWKTVNQQIFDLYQEVHAGRRWAAVMEWANVGAPLFAAPECGMSSDAAGKWLRAWDSTGNSVEKPEVRERLREGRLNRAEAALKRAEKPSDRTHAEALVRQIDADFQDHAWVRLIEQRR